jgi:hypothetical protein
MAEDKPLPFTGGVTAQYVHGDHYRGFFYSEGKDVFRPIGTITWIASPRCQLTYTYVGGTAVGDGKARNEKNPYTEKHFIFADWHFNQDWFARLGWTTLQAHTADDNIYEGYAKLGFKRWCKPTLGVYCAYDPIQSQFINLEVSKGWPIFGEPGRAWCQSVGLQVDGLVSYYHAGTARLSINDHILNVMSRRVDRRANGRLWLTNEPWESGWQRYEVKVSVPVKLDKLLNMSWPLTLTPAVEFIGGLSNKSDRTIEFYSTDGRTSDFRLYSIALTAKF